VASDNAPEPPVDEDHPEVPPPPAASAQPEALGGRLHPAAIGVDALGQLIPLAFLAFAGPVGIPFVTGFAALGLGLVALKWWRFTWRVDNDTLVIEQGLLERRRRIIPIDRIQSVELVRKLRHRVFGVAALRVESIGGDDAEGQLDALDPEFAEYLRSFLLRAAPATEGNEGIDRDERDRGETLVRLGFGQLVVAGLTGGRVGVAAAILGFGQQLWFDRFMEIEFLQPALLNQARRSLALIAILALVAIVAVFAVSVLATAVTFWNFTLTQQGQNIGVRRGLLEQRSDTIPLQRIQAVRIEQNLLRRAFGLAAMKIEVAGRAGSSGDQRQTDVVLPVGSLERARQLADRLLGEDAAHTPLASMPTAARTRRMLRTVPVGVVAALPGFVDPRGFAGGLVILPLLAFAVAAYRALGWARTNGHVLARSGVFVRRLWLVPAAAVQSLEASSTPFQRRRGLASVTLHIARSGNAGDPQVLDLAGIDGQELTRQLAAASTQAGRDQVRSRRFQLARSG
jgi:putative membrane protein